MNSDYTKSTELYKESKLNYEKIKKDIYILFDEYKNKEEISIILEYWLWNINIILSIYGVEFFNFAIDSEIYIPYLFSTSLDNLYSSDSSLEIKNNKLKFLFISKLINNLYLSGYSPKNLNEKIKYRLSKKFIDYIPIKKNFKLRDRIIDLIVNYFSDVKVNNLEDFISRKLPLLFYSEPIDYIDMPINIKCSAACFLEFNNYENIFLINSEINIEGYQHGGGYGAFINDYFWNFEKSLCKKFFGWGLSKLNIRQTRYKKIKKYNSDNKRIIWIEYGTVNKFSLMTQPNFYESIKNCKTIDYIYRELKTINYDYYNLIHPLTPAKRYKKYHNKILLGRRFNVEALFYKNDIGIFDNCASSLIYFFIENKIPFLQIISRNDYKRFTLEQKNWFKVLFNNGLSLYNDEEGKLALRLKHILNNDYKIPRDVINYHKKIFMI